jgi:hypothetical protein
MGFLDIGVTQQCMRKLGVKNQSYRADKISSENLNTKKNGWFAAPTILYIIPQYARTTTQIKEHKFL